MTLADCSSPNQLPALGQHQRSLIRDGLGTPLRQFRVNDCRTNKCRPSMRVMPIPNSATLLPLMGNGPGHVMPA